MINGATLHESYLSKGSDVIRRTYFISCDVFLYGNVISSHCRVFDKISWFKIKDRVVIESAILDMAESSGNSVQDYSVRSFNRL